MGMLVAVGILMGSALSQAALVSGTSWDGSGNTLQALLNARTSPGSAPDVNANQLTADERWSLIDNPATRGSTTRETTIATIVVEVAGFANVNEFGVYRLGKTDPGYQLRVFQGSNDAGDSKTITLARSGANWTVSVGNSSLSVPGGQFGFYLKNGNDPRQTFFSETALNPGGADQLATYRGKTGQTIWTGRDGGNKTWGANDFVLAWEDLPYASGDKDFQDFVVLLQSGCDSLLTPVPETSTVIAGLGALLILGISGWRARKR
jgi:hypothetical protein